MIRTIRANTDNDSQPDLKTEISALEIFKDVPRSLMDGITSDMQQYFVDGTLLFHQGDPADSLFLILHGQYVSPPAASIWYREVHTRSLENKLL